ncbi:hypothetical protein NLU13_8549 [Sarocladium strictum]|uniref:Uncharacterized protein n=1 Tax=Sarocladium strictum TaxID=5046 RepID=A0AA39GD41_SARSR|nr:hypothetical protein NLU13_8549 [Sarocladium strictum]
MKFLKACVLFAHIAYSLAYERDGCHGDNCANHVTGTFGRIGVPVQSRIALCNSYLRATIKPAPTTVTRVVTKYTTQLPDTTSHVPASIPLAISANNSVLKDKITLPSVVPVFASEKCPSAGQFSSACACWTNITASTTTLPRSTSTATRTTYLDVSCSPAATAVSKAQQFPCSRQWGMCSCLTSEEDGDVCVRVGEFGVGGGGYGGGQGPCEKSKECNSKGGCDEKGTICVYDGSCKCGKRRCYRAAPRGCEYQGMPMDGPRH